MEKFGPIYEVLDFAIKREIEAKDFYLELADLFLKLAQEEAKHKLRYERSTIITRACHFSSAVRSSYVSRFLMTEYLSPSTRTSAARPRAL